MKDLVLLVPDKNTQYALRGGLNRHEAMGIRRIDFEFIVHPGRDGGARRTGPQLLALKKAAFSHALLLFDYEGSGASATAGKIEENLDRELIRSWGSRAKTVVIEPELDIWMWGSDNAIEQILGWPHSKHIRPWLEERRFIFAPTGKPIRPKEALETSLREVGEPRSSALYERIARQLSLPRCSDPAFGRLAAKLREWFPPTDEGPAR